MRFVSRNTLIAYYLFARRNRCSEITTETPVELDCNPDGRKSMFSSRQIAATVGFSANHTDTELQRYRFVERRKTDGPSPVGSDSMSSVEPKPSPCGALRGGRVYGGVGVRTDGFQTWRTTGTPLWSKSFWSPSVRYTVTAHTRTRAPANIIFTLVFDFSRNPNRTTCFLDDTWSPSSKRTRDVRANAR